MCICMYGCMCVWYSGDAEVYRWNLETFGCMGRYLDEGGSPTTALAYSPDGAYIAIGYVATKRLQSNTCGQCVCMDWYIPLIYIQFICTCMVI
jgi:hypothetical protein